MDVELPIPTMIVVTASFFNSVNMSQEIQVAAQKSLQDAGNFMRQQVRASVQNGPAPLKFHEGILDGNVHPAAGACAFSVFMWWCCLLRIKKNNIALTDWGDTGFDCDGPFPPYIHQQKVSLFKETQ